MFAAESTTNFEPLAQLLKAAGDDLRLTILQVLARDSYGVLELAEAFAVKVRERGASATVTRPGLKIDLAALPALAGDTVTA